MNNTDKHYYGILHEISILTELSYTIKLDILRLNINVKHYYGISILTKLLGLIIIIP